MMCAKHEMEYGRPASDCGDCARITVECSQCGAEYDAENPGPEAHDPDCMIRNVKIEQGQWDDPEVVE